MNKQKKITFEFSINRIRTQKFFIDNTYINEIKKEHQFFLDIEPKVIFLENDKIFVLIFIIGILVAKTEGSFLQDPYGL
jgi:hypothetical protein